MKTQRGFICVPCPPAHLSHQIYLGGYVGTENSYVRVHATVTDIGNSKFTVPEKKDVQVHKNALMNFPSLSFIRLFTFAYILCYAGTWGSYNFALNALLGLKGLVFYVSKNTAKDLL